MKVFKNKPQQQPKSILVDRSKDQNQDILYELGPQYGLLLDLNHERTGMNKRANETHLEYIDRLCKNSFGEQSHDHALPEFPPAVYQQRNALQITHPETYYFSISSGEKK